MTDRTASRPIPADSSGQEHLAPAENAGKTDSVDNSIVNNVVYLDGRPAASPATLADTFQLLERLPDSMAWIGLYRPAEAQLMAAADQLGLHELAVEDAVTARQRPKLERYGDTLFVVLRSAHYRDDTEDVDFGELHLFVGRNFVLTVRHSESPDLAAVRRRLEDEPDLLRLGPEAVLYAVLDAVVDGYAPVVAGLQHDIEEIETDVFGRDPHCRGRWSSSNEPPAPCMRCSTASRPGSPRMASTRNCNATCAAWPIMPPSWSSRPTASAACSPTFSPSTPPWSPRPQNEEMRRLAEASNAQNEQIKRISSWAAILFAPTLIGTTYGMNFRHMPELSWVWGYLFALVLMAIVCTGLYLIFKRRSWL